MEQGCTSRYSKLIDRLLVEDLSPAKMGELRGHMASCPACQHRYNRVVLASRLLEGGPRALDNPSDREIAWVEQAVLERARLVPDAEPARRSTVLRWVVGLASVAAVAAIVLPVVLTSTPPPNKPGPAVAPPTEFAARGAPPKLSPQVGVRALCIQRQKDKPDPVVFEATFDPTSATPAGGPTCGVSDILRFTYTNRSKMSYLFLVGIDQKYRIKWYEPHPPKKTSIKVQKDAVNEMLSRAVRLGVNHEEGLLRLFAIFSPRPLHAEMVKHAVESARRERTPLTRLDLLQVEDTEQRSILVNLSRGKVQ
jgi:hypothetical protein